MIKYARITNHETGSVEVALSSGDEVWKTQTKTISNPSGGVKIVTETLYWRDFYEEIGMTLMDVEQSPSGGWYVAGRVPPEPEKVTVLTFSKFKIWFTARSITIPGSEKSVWDAFEEFLKANDLLSGWYNLNELEEDNDLFQQYYPSAVEAFGKDVIDGILAEAVSAVNTKIKGA